MPVLDGVAATERLIGARRRPRAARDRCSHDVRPRTQQRLRRAPRGRQRLPASRDAAARGAARRVSGAVAGGGDAGSSRRLRRAGCSSRSASISPGPRADDPRLVTLTEREQTVLLAVARGASNAEIGTELHLGPRAPSRPTSAGRSPSSTRAHRVQLVVFAYEAGLVRAGARPSVREPRLEALFLAAYAEDVKVDDRGRRQRSGHGAQPLLVRRRQVVAQRDPYARRRRLGVR